MDLIKTLSLSSINTILKKISGIITNKFAAIYLGPAGIAVVGHFMNFISIITQLSTAGTGNGITKIVSEYHKDRGSQTTIISTSFRLIAISTAIISLITVIFSKYFSLMIFNDADHKLFICIISVTLFLTSIISFVGFVLNGLQKIKKMLLQSLAGTFIGLAIMPLLVSQLGLMGALYSYVVIQFSLALVVVMFNRKEWWFRLGILYASFDKNIAKKVLKFSLMAFTSMACVTGVQMFNRNYIIHSIGIDNAGLWQGMIKISDMYLSVITVALSTYYIPKLSSISDTLLLKKEIFNGYKTLLPLTILMCSFLWFFRALIIKLLFSPKFLPMEQMFVFQVIGDFFKVSSLLLACLMISKSLTRIYIVTEVVFGIMNVVLNIFFIKKYGLIGSSIAYMSMYISYLLVIIVIFLFYFKKLGYTQAGIGKG